MGAVACLLGSGAFAARQPLYVGEDTALRKALERLDSPYQAVYTSAALVVTIRIHSEQIDHHVKTSSDPCCTWLLPIQFTENLTKEQIALVRQSRFTLITREDDRVTCVVNELNSSRIWTETRFQQDKTAVEMPCAKIWENFETLATIPEKSQMALSVLLTASHRKP